MTATGQSARAPEQLFAESLPVIDRILAVIARRHGLTTADADEFAAWARVRLTDNDYSILRKFSGRSSISTYLSVVLANLFRDYRNSIWGRWRPSAAAQRLGPVAIRLEELLSRDGSSLRESIGILQSAGVALSEKELTQLAARLPHRVTTGEVPLDNSSTNIQANPAPSLFFEEERQQIEATLKLAIADLPDEDRVITRMRFWDNIGIADIARTLGLDQKPLYRRIEAIQRRLKTSMAARGLTDEAALDFLRGEGFL